MSISLTPRIAPLRRTTFGRITLRITLTASVLVFLASGGTAARAQKKDYLSQTEADKIRDADTPSDRVKLLISFASDRLKKLQYELAHPGDSLHRADRLNALINGYTGCVDDAAEWIDLTVEKQQDVRDGIKDMQAHAPEFLTALKEIVAKKPENDAYKDNLDDAVDATTDAIKGADEAIKENAPPPVRRRPQ
jgi:Flp pilus assembly CpaE family ATPase